jgi:hypothetical protein
MKEISVFVRLNGVVAISVQASGKGRRGVYNGLLFKTWHVITASYMTIFDNTQHRFRRKKGVREFQKFHPPIPTPTSIFVVPFPITLAKHYILDLCESYRGVYKLSFYQKHRESSQYT